MTSSTEEVVPTKGNKIAQKTKDLVKNLRPAQLFAPLVTLGVGYRLGVKSATLSVGKAGSRTAADAAQKTLLGRAKEWPIVSAILLTFALREIWMITPKWLKRNIPYIGRKISSSTDDDPDDMTSLTSLSFKLQSLYDVAQSKMQSQEALAGSDAQVAFFALLQLVAQIKDRFSRRRDDRYKDAGEELDANELEGYDEFFELADWAYNEFEEDESLNKALASLDYTLVRHDETALPGFVAHYIALHKGKKQVLISIKGTSGFEDMLTDVCGRAVEFELKNGPFVEDGPVTIHCHEGILLAARQLARDVETVVEELFLPNNYRIVITGHSLGAGAAALLGILLRSRFEELRSDPGKRLKVLAFASPPVVDYEASLACESFCTTIVNNSDIIPRASLSNLVVMMEFLKILNKKLEEKGIKPKDFKSAGKFIEMLTKSDGNMIMSVDEIKEGMEDAFEKVDMKDPDHMYVAGKVYHMYDLWSKDGYGEVEDAVQEEAADKVKEDVDQEEAEKDLLSVRTAEKVYAGHGASSVLRLIELDPRMLTDHLSPAYRSSLRALLSSVEKRSAELVA